MKIKLFTVVLAVFAFEAFAQKTCSGILTDSLTKEALEFANIGVIGKGIGTVTNGKGEYSFTIPDSLSDQLVRISLIGYNSRTYSVKNFEGLHQVKLGQNAKLLNEVSVSAKKTKIKVVGNDTRNKRLSGGFTKNSLGAELGIKIEVKHPQTQLRKVMFNINANKLDTFPVFRVNVYKADGKGFPGENILKHNIIVTPKEKTGFTEVDLIPYNIFSNEDLFVSIEWVKDLGDVKGLYFSTKLVGSTTYYRVTSQAKWEKIPSIGIGVHAEIAY